MALESMNKARENLTCAICIETYRDPKMLNCFHIFCKSCLEALTVNSDNVLLCPACRAPTTLQNGVEGLNAAHHINHVLEAHDSLSKMLSLSSITSDETISSGYDSNLGSDWTSRPEHGREQEHSNAAPSPKTRFSLCSEHKQKELELFCDTCSELICFQCTLRTHNGHTYDMVEVVIEKHTAEISSSLKPLNEKLMVVDRALTQLDARREEISVQQAAIEANVHATIRSFQEALDIRKTELLARLHQTAQGKLKDLNVQRDEMETAQIQLNTCVSMVMDKLQRGNCEEILKKKASLMNQERENSTPFRPDFLTPRAKSDTMFSSSLDFISACKNFGEIHSSEMPDPSKSYAIGKGLVEATIKEKINVFIQVINFNGEPCKEIVSSLTCELISEITGVMILGSVIRKEQSQCEISYQPTMKGRHQLKIMMEDQQIKNSPFNVIVKLPIAKLGSPILTLDTVKRPTGITIIKTGELVVTDLETMSAIIMSPAGVERRKMVTYGAPCDVTVDAEGNMAAAECYGGYITQFRPDGSTIQQIGGNGSGERQFIDSRGIAFHTNNNKYYICDGGNHRIQILNSDLSFYRCFGKKGTGKGQLRNPTALAINSTGKVFVAEVENNRIQCFTADGVSVSIIKQLSPGKGELRGPKAIAIDTRDTIYVSEACHRISVFNSEGHYITSFGSQGNGVGEFDEPRGLVVDDSGVLYVCDLKNNRIQLF